MTRHKGSKNKVNKQIKCICNICKKVFWKYPSDIKVGKGKHCSRKCQFEYQRRNPNKGCFKNSHKVPKKWRMATSKRHKGNKFSPERCKEMSLRTMGHFVSEETRIKISKSHKGKKKKYPVWNKGKKLPQFSGENAAHWKGGQKLNRGYVYIYKPNHPFCDHTKCVRRSRFIMEQKIGRYLKRREVVHHINSIKDDDRIENLMLFKNNSEHMKYHHKKI